MLRLLNYEFKYLREVAYFRISTKKYNDITQAILRFYFIHFVEY